MKVVDAVWEKRNLGVTCMEFTIEDGDEVDEVRRQLDQHTAEYMVAKAPASRIDILFALAEKGFTCIECRFDLEHNLKNIEPTGLEKRMNDAVTCHLVDENSLPELLEKCREKVVFGSDRISQDPHFTPAQAAQRTVGWIGDEFNRGAKVFNLVYKNDYIGFTIIRDIGDRVYLGLLAGLFDTTQHLGLGKTVIFKPIYLSAKLGGRKHLAAVSSNNLTSLNSNVALGCRIVSTYYVYVKHTISDSCSVQQKQHKAD